jgi:hypothetical protein
LEPALPGGPVTLASFTATLNGETVGFTDSNGDGTFEAQFRFLLPGTYQLTVGAPAGLAITTDLTLPVSVSLDAGETTTEAVTIQSAVLAP